MPYVFKWPFPKDHKTLQTWKFSSRFTIVGVMAFAKLIGGCLNTIHVHNKHRLMEAVSQREEKQPLVTVINHTSVIDDPVLHSVFPWKTLIERNFRYPRWCVVAQDICCSRSLHTYFFARGRNIPVIRGDGVYQKAIDFCIEKLNHGEWVHIFPEGAVNMENVYQRLKWGVGRMIAESERTPLIVPMWHVGMDDLRPNKEGHTRIHRGKHVTLLVGEYINVDDLIAEMRSAKDTPQAIRKAITDKIQENLFALRKQAEELHGQLLVENGVTVS
ncbi:hypothetical protein CAPTEDRAFT_153654 [Capitella teleta]|uniref:Tafazzin family protein n=1 Tax=Capitella teleta TaxID=283909 RepID=R7UIT6_CAPTE|nr:hypothetical protein CAPTEDRAFT_153654 [Capitella teleta]|eukprot:ELU03197.1 hypothetical protein CAPTEDRAFT_153654 [Capitella teleta]